MSLSRPARFPLLKLPWLCIKCVLHNSDEFVLIYFATISNRTRRIVKSSNYPLKEIDVSLSGSSRISIKYQLGKTKNEKYWYFIHDKNADNGKYVLQGGTQPFRISRHFDSWRGHNLYSYTAGDKVDALKVGIEFMIEVFGCTIGRLFVDGNKLSELLRLGISSVNELFINGGERVNLTDLKFLVEKIKVTDEYVFCAPIAEDFSCDPRIFKCRQLLFACDRSADWVTLELLCQFDVPQLFFSYQRFSVEEIVVYINNWFNSENRKLEYLFVSFNNPVTLGDFKIDHLNPMPFCEKRRNRCLMVKGWEEEDISSGIDILRQDGLLATLHSFTTAIIFYVWHERFPDPV
ncbi:unnamed protein product [Caenorhabditis brenneri]